ncbi:MAG TPA: hypothetical protein VMX17_17675 [Candidatus Glassbacteria bacterium]|nr:hypothetical protein [Candidatus Glassbacteria bacterium]
MGQNNHLPAEERNAEDIINPIGIYLSHLVKYKNGTAIYFLDSLYNNFRKLKDPKKTNRIYLRLVRAYEKEVNTSSEYFIALQTKRFDDKFEFVDFDSLPLVDRDSIIKRHKLSNVNRKSLTTTLQTVDDIQKWIDKERLRVWTLEEEKGIKKVRSNLKYNGYVQKDEKEIIIDPNNRLDTDNVAKGNELEKIEKTKGEKSLYDKFYPTNTGAQQAETITGINGDNIYLGGSFLCSNPNSIPMDGIVSWNGQNNQAEILSGSNTIPYPPAVPAPMDNNSWFSIGYTNPITNPITGAPADSWGNNCGGNPCGEIGLEFAPASKGKPLPVVAHEDETIVIRRKKKRISIVMVEEDNTIILTK